MLTTIIVTSLALMVTSVPTFIAVSKARFRNRTRLPNPKSAALSKQLIRAIDAVRIDPDEILIVHQYKHVKPKSSRVHACSTVVAANALQINDAAGKEVEVEVISHKIRVGKEHHFVAYCVGELHVKGFRRETYAVDRVVVRRAIRTIFDEVKLEKAAQPYLMVMVETTFTIPAKRDLIAKDIIADNSVLDRHELHGKVVATSWLQYVTGYRNTKQFLWGKSTSRGAVG